MATFIDSSAIEELGAPDGNVDRHIHRIAERAYDISQELVPQPGRPGDPYATGRLKESGKVVRGPGRAWDVEYGTNHAIYVELGTRHMKAEPYLRPALLLAVRNS